MPPRSFSRHIFTTGVLGLDDITHLEEREPYRFRTLSDTRVHVVRTGDTLYHLASRHFRTVAQRAAGLWWIIADFQPQPIVDPTVKLAEGSVLFIPSPRTVIEEVFSESRRDESNVT